MANENEGGMSTLGEIIEEQDRLEDQANAVLGGSDDTDCTYEKGYIKRQALYSCLDCTKEGKLAGICLACSLDCHPDHNLIELYTKRKFKCDCGNSKMKNDCQRCPTKDELNDHNKYSQNFSGVYCTCSRPYPDPEAENEEEMIQCVVCEDWFHDNHCGSVAVPDCSSYEDFICAQCIQKHPSLVPYANNWAIVEPVVDVEGDSQQETETKRPRLDESHRNTQKLEPYDEQEACRWQQLSSAASTPSGSGAFWPEGWRQALCRCADCRKRLESEGIEFLLDVEDSLQWYEQSGREKSSTTLEGGMKAFSDMNRVQQIELATGYASMKAALSDHLKKLSEEKSVVTKEDVEEFFALLKKKKHEPAVQYNCK